MQINPIIAAVHAEASLKSAVESDCRVLFLLSGSIMDTIVQVDQIHSAGKKCIVHLDLIDGLSGKEGAVDVIHHFTAADGIISTRVNQIKRARQLGLAAIQRGFMIDSRSLKSFESQVQLSRPDFVELLPGLLPQIIADLKTRISPPIIVGGLIRYKSDVIAAIRAGAIAVSVSQPDIWSM